MKHIFWILFFIIVEVNISHADASDGVRISILTCGPGHEIYSIYGHNAIRIRDDIRGFDLVYNYGTFDFKTKGFILKFMRGKLPYVLDVADFSMFYAEYHHFQRSVTEQVLDLDSTQKAKILAFLDDNMLPENRMYKYDFFMDNCATRLRDIIEKNVTECNYNNHILINKTYRDIIKEYQKDLPWTNFGIDLIIGAPADQLVTTQQSAFIPDYLATILDNTNCSGNNPHLLVQSKNQILDFKNRQSSPPIFFLGPIFVFIILLVIEINLLVRSMKGETHRHTRSYDILWFSVMTLACLLMLFMWFGTDHIPTKYNWNLLWASPLIPLWWYLKDSKFGIKISFYIYGLLLMSIVNAMPGVQILPQYFHPAIILISLILIVKIYRNTNKPIVP